MPSQSYFLLPKATEIAHTSIEMYNAIAGIIPIRNINPPNNVQMNAVLIKDELKSLPFDIKLIINTPKTISNIVVPKSPPVPHPLPTQKIYLSIFCMKSSIPVVLLTAVIL